MLAKTCESLVEVSNDSEILPGYPSDFRAGTRVPATLVLRSCIQDRLCKSVTFAIIAAATGLAGSSRLCSKEVAELTMMMMMIKHLFTYSKHQLLQHAVSFHFGSWQDIFIKHWHRSITFLN
jgi:hypothetical protein